MYKNSLGGSQSFWMLTGGATVKFSSSYVKKMKSRASERTKNATFFRTNQAWCSCRQKVPTLLLTYVKAPCSRTHLLKTKVYPLQSDAGAFDMMSSAKASGLTFRDHITSVVSRGHLRAMQLWRCFHVKILISWLKHSLHMLDQNSFNAVKSSLKV